MDAEKYLREQIPTMVGENHVASMKLTTMIGLLNGYASQFKDNPVTELNERNSVDDGEKSFMCVEPLHIHKCSKQCRGCEIVQGRYK